MILGSEVYSKEELVAESCAAFLCSESGIENALDNSAAYINGWARALRKDKRLMITAAGQGQRATDSALSSLFPNLFTRVIAQHSYDTLARLPWQQKPVH